MYISLVLCSLLCSCRPFSVREAQKVVVVADSLRVHEGVAYDDSVALAEAYSTLERWRWIYPDDYARASYYYGRLLRNRGDQVAAMQVFIRGSYAPYVQRVVPLLWFSDYHILGRIYSNMGTMCHLIDEFGLGYDMYERSAKAFHTAGDTTAYYYALNSMALELSEQKLHHETLALLDSIEKECTDAGVLTKLWETKAILYENLASYDSAIIAANVLYSRGYYAPTGYVIEAQAYWHLQQYDSALCYANFVLNSPYASDQDKYHMLYIICNHDTTLDAKGLQELAARRADINYVIMEPYLQKLSVATELLQQDRKSNRPYINLILLLLTLCVVGGTTWLARTRTKQFTIREWERRQQLTQQNAYIHQRNERIKKQYLSHREKLLHEIEHNCDVFRNSSDWKEKLNWKDYNAFCKTVDNNFLLLASRLKGTYKLDEKEVRLCVLALLDVFSNKQLAKHLYYSESGIGTFKYRVSQKLNIQSKDLRTFLLELAVTGTPQNVKL